MEIQNIKIWFCLILIRTSNEPVGFVRNLVNISRNGLFTLFQN